jgi:pimeloyl-ACP methyl ester carboxylesterase
MPKVSTPTKFLSPSRTSNLESSFDDSYDLASTTRYLRSTRLTTLMTLQRPLYAGSVISLADVGDVGGHAVFLFLGLGAVRYLAGLYDDMASALGLRLICIDRWGMGKTDDLPADRRGILEWSEVVREVADRLGVGRFSILAHSAGAPYAMALSLSLGHRLAGPIHLLAPWVSAALESGYKWLRYVPDGIIKTAQAAEWRMQGWKLGASTLSPDTSVSFKKANGTNQAPPDFHRTNNALQALQSFDSSTASSLTQGESVYFSPLPSPSLIGESPFYDGQTTACSSQSSSRLTKFKGRQSASDRAKDAAIADVSGSSSYEMTEDFALIKAWHARSHSDTATIQDNQPPPLPPKTPMRHNRVVSTRADVSLASLPSPSTPASSGKRQSLTPSLDLPTELLRASHAESSGSASDLLVILGRSSQKPWGFSYIDVKHPVLVWHGERDERVSVSSVLWMERELDNCKVNIIKNADHSLMTNVDVVVEALESIVATLF